MTTELEERHKEAMKLAWRMGNDAWKPDETRKTRMLTYEEAVKVSKALIFADGMADRAKRAEQALRTRIDRLAARFATAMLSIGAEPDFSKVIDDAYRAAEIFAKKAKSQDLDPTFEEDEEENE